MTTSMLGLLVPLLLTGAQPEETIATVDKRPITAIQLAQRYAATKAAGGTPRVEDLLQDLINEDLLAADGYARKLDNTAGVVAAAESARRKLAVERFLEDELFATIKISDEQVKTLFHDTGDSVRLKVIVLASDADAKAAIDRLNKGSKFEVEALQSLNPVGAKSGGDMGDMTRGMADPKLKELAFSAPLNTVLGPVQLSLGSGVVMVVARYIADEKELPARRGQIEAFATTQSRAVYRRHYVQQMRGKFNVELDEAFLKSTGARNVATPEEAAHVIAQVRGTPVRYADVLSSMRATVGAQASGHMSGTTVKREFAWSEVDRLVLEAAAVEAGYDKKPGPVAAGKTAERVAIIQALAETVRAAVPTPDRAALEAYLAGHSSEYTQPGTRTCSHLVLKTREEAALARTRVTRGERLEDLAAELSIDRATAPRGGLIGQLDDNRLAAAAKSEPALAAALKPPMPDQLSEPVQSKDGWHLVRCSAASPPRVAKLQDVEQSLHGRIRAEWGNDAVVARMQQLRGKATVSIDAAAVQRAVSAMNGRTR